MNKINQNNEEVKQNIFLSDSPILSEKEDILGRRKFTSSLSKTILRYNDQNTIVIGLYGKWGSGKSSIINILLHDIRETKEFLENDKPIIIEFNPWNFSEQNNLASVFFNEIANNLNHADKSEKARKISERLKLYSYFLHSTSLVSNALRYLLPLLLFLIGLIVLGASYFTQLKIIAWITSILLIGLSVVLQFSKNLMSSVSDVFLQYSKLNEKTLKQLKDELNELILERKKRFLIVIDDIDRLNTKEIKQIFQLVKLNADFNNTLYLLAFDRDIIEKSLEEQDGVSGKEYLEKIVQVSFDVPLVQEDKLYTYLFSQLDEIVKAVPEKFWDTTKWGNLFHGGFKELFSSLRDVKRYINSLKFNFSLIRQENSFELNPMDFIALEAIRVFAPETYNAMRGEADLLTHTNSGTSGGRENEQERKQRVDSIVDKTNETLREPIKEIMVQLFPQIRGLYERGHGSYGRDWQERWTKELRICATQLFDRYFILDVPEGEISQYEVDKLLEATSDKDAFSQLLEDHLKNGRIKKVLIRLQEHTDTFNLDHAQNIIIPLINISDRLPEEVVGFFDSGTDMCIMRIIYHYLKRIKDKAKRSAVLKEAIKNSEGLFACVEKISIEIQGIEKKTEHDRLISEADVDEFKALCVDKIRKFHREGKLSKHRKMGYIIYDWIRWASLDEVKKFTSELTTTDDGLVSLTKAFLSQSQSMGMGDRVSRVKWSINYKNLREFVDLDKAQERLGKIDTSKLGDREKLAVGTFLKDFDKKDKPNDRWDDDD